jgi:hypothetical protein
MKLSSSVVTEQTPDSAKCSCDRSWLCNGSTKAAGQRSSKATTGAGSFGKSALRFMPRLHGWGDCGTNTLNATILSSMGQSLIARNGCVSARESKDATSGMLYLSAGQEGSHDDKAADV